MSETDVLRKEVKKYIDKADDKTLEIVCHILEAADETFDPLANMTKEQEESFYRGMEDINAGRVTPHKEVMKKYIR